MDISERTRRLRASIEKQAAANQAPKLPDMPDPPKAGVTDKKKLFPTKQEPPKLGGNKDDVDFKIDEAPKIPEMNVNGSNPEFKSKMKKNNPYNTQ